MKKYNALFASVLFLMTLTMFVSAQSNDPDVRTGIATLYANDPLAQTFCFRDGKYGAIIQENEIRNRCSDISFDSYESNSFSVGIEGARLGKIINLGTRDELQKRYKYQETVGKGQGFASIQIKDGKLHLLKERRPMQLQELLEASELDQTKATDSTAVNVGSIYILRLTDRTEKDFERIVKILVTDYQPDRSVTFRWQVIKDSEAVVNESNLSGGE